MRTVLFLLDKEFRQIFRNKALLAVMMVAPIMQLIIFPLAADYEVKNINIAIIDNDHSDFSRDLINSIRSSGYFKISGYFDSYEAALKLMESDKADIIMDIPAGFERDVVREKSQKLFVGINAINGVKATLGASYLSRIISCFNGEIIAKLQNSQSSMANTAIDIASSAWYNPLMNYRFLMVPGILALLVTMIGAYMCAINIVKENEQGTIEQINVTPIKKYQFLLGKLLPFLIIGVVVFSIGLFGVARFIYGIVPQGSLWLLFGYLLVYLVAVLGLGLLISTYSETQQQAMSVTFFFMMIFTLMSGLFTPIEGMPQWAYVITRLSPITYFIDVMRLIVLKGANLGNITQQFAVMALFAIVINTWAILNYRKTN